MTVSTAQARDALRLLLVMMAVDDQSDPDEPEAIRAAMRALDGHLGRTNVTRAIETLSALGAASLAVEHTELVWSSLMAGLDAIIAQTLASGIDRQIQSFNHSPCTPPPFSAP
jgi:hypothetical protein